MKFWIERKQVAAALLSAAVALGFATAAQAQSRAVMVGTGSTAHVNQEGSFFRGGFYGSSGVTGGFVAMPNGKYTEYTEDLVVKVAGGYVRWTRDFNGNQWRFNPHWLSLEFEFDTIVYASSSSGGGGGGGGSVAMAVREAPPEYFGGTLVPGTDGSMGPSGRNGPLWAISRNGAWFKVDSTNCNFSIENTGRYVLKPIFSGENKPCPTNNHGSRSIGVISSGGSGSGGGGGGGSISMSPALIFAAGSGGMPSNVAGFRWEDRMGSWIDYDRTGRVIRYGDRNNITVTMQYTGGRLTGVLDHTNRLVMSIAYDGDRVSEVRDVPAAGDTEPARVVRYQYASNGSISRVTDVRGNVTQYGYDNLSRLTTITDPENRVRRLAYGPTSRVTSLTQQDGAVIEYEYDYDSTKKQFLARSKLPVVNGQRRVEVSIFDSDGKRIIEEVNNRVQRELAQDGRSDRITDGRGNVTETQRNEFFQVIGVRNADGSTLSNQFDARTLAMTQQRDLNGFTHTFENDDYGNLRRQTLAVGSSDQRIAEYTRDSRHRVVTGVWKGRTEANGVVSRDLTYVFEYDDQDNVTAVTDPEGKIYRYTYNRAGQVLTATSPTGGVWRYGYDAGGNMVSAQSPMGFTRTYGYDGVSNETRMTDARSGIYRAFFDGMNREVRSVDPYGAEYLTEYNQLGAISALIDATGKFTRFEYDAWMRPTRSVDAKGNVYEMDYAEPDGRDNGARRPSKIKYPTFERRFRYNQRNFLSQQTDLDGTDGRTEQFTYDGEGRHKTLTDPNGKTRTLDYNPYGQLVRVADSLGNSSRATYDAHGQLIELIDPNGRRTRLTYDGRGLVTSETDPLQKTTRYAYDDNGWLTQKTYADGSRIEYGYDDDGRLTVQREYSPSASLRKTTTFAYDQEDNLVQWSDGAISAALTYDAAGRVSGETLNFGPFSKSRSYTYYPNQQVRTYTGPDGVTITFSYDAQGQLERASIPDEGDISVTEWQWVARKKVLLPGGSEQQFDYDGTLMATRLRVLNPGRSTVFELEEKYGRYHELSERKLDGVTTGFTYDDAYRLTRAEGANAAFNEGYTVDAAGNRVSDSRTGTAAWTYDDANQLLQRGTVSYSYDDNGRLVRKVDSALPEPRRTTQYSYDTPGRLTEVRDGAGALLARYTYDPFDRRLSKQLGENGPVVYYYPSPTGLLAEMDAAGNVVASYGWHPEHEDSTYPMYARVPATTGGMRYVYYHNDHLGTPYRITDKAGKLVWSAQYDGFGKAAVTLPAEDAVTNNLRFPGQYFDAETGLHYNNRRFYDPETGRYITRDPIGLEGGTNLYAYARHSPTNWTDPSGEIIPCLAVNYLRCMVSCMLVGAATDYVLDCGNINWGDNAKQCALDCLLAMLPIPNPCGKFGQWLSAGIGAFNSFTAETLVHVKPQGASAADAMASVAVLKPISELRPGDEVLSLAEWKDKGSAAHEDKRLSYERVSEVYSSLREQTVVKVFTDDGVSVEATDGHPFKTTAGWRDALTLQQGDKILLKSDATPGTPERMATVSSVLIERRTVPVYNLEVANAHTFFVGENGAMAHNGRCTPKMRREWEKLHGKPWPKNPPTEKIRPGGNQDGHHIKPVYKGGGNEASNITPMTPSEHMAHHKKHGYKD